MMFHMSKDKMLRLDTITRYSATAFDTYKLRISMEEVNGFFARWDDFFRLTWIIPTR